MKLHTITMNKTNRVNIIIAKYKSLAQQITLTEYKEIVKQIRNKESHKNKIKKKKKITKNGRKKKSTEK